MKTPIKELVLARLLRWTSALLTRSGHSALATQFIRAAHELLPAAMPPYAYAYALWNEGQFQEARAILQRILAVKPGHAEANNLLGVIYFNDEEMELAGEHFRKAIQQRPEWAAPNNNLGNIHRSKNELKEAEQYYRKALACNPDYVEALTNLGIILNNQGALNKEAETYCRKAVELAPGYAGAHCNLGNVLITLGRLEEAVVAYNEALRLQPGIPEALANLALILEDTGYLAGTIDYYEKQLLRNPGDHVPNVKIAQAMFVLERYDDARQRLERALMQNPEAVQTLFVYSYYFIQIGDARTCVDTMQRVLDFGPNASAETAIIFNSMYLAEHSGEQLCTQYREWAEKYANCPLLPPPKHALRSSGHLRIGYVSRDFARHSVAFFLEPVLRHHDHSSFKVFCYSTRYHEDDFTARFKGYADVWRNISLMPEKELVDLIREDGIDILIDLSGHTVGHRLGAFACKPAPVQVTYLGHPSTTGIPAIDYRLGDVIVDPIEVTATHYVERLWHLPGCFLTYQPSADTPDVAPSPSREKGYVTFGSFNNVAKINDRVIAVWAEILATVPTSRLLLKSYAFGSTYGRKRLIDGFASHGIDQSRLELLDWSSDTVSHLDLYREVDIALDPFPYNGTTTTCEALWMGVPVVTLIGDRHSGRVGLSLLTSLGLEHMACASAEAYVQCAAKLASEGQSLSSLRNSLRERMRASPLLDNAGFVRKLEGAYRSMWQAHLKSVEATAIAGETEADQLRLHIGGSEAKAGWKILNITPAANVDFVGDVRDLSMFESNSIAEVYASHVLEHVDQNSIVPALQGIRRILYKPGGRLMISVPDMEVLCRLFLRDDLGSQERTHIMRMLFGGQVDAHDYHKIGLYFENLAEFLKQSGFHDIRRVESFALFDDTSDYSPYGERISLNIVAGT